MLCLGTAGLIRLKIITDPVPVAKRLVGGEYAMLSLLFLVSATGLLLLVVRHTGAMGVMLALHLGLVLALFVALPYSKMVHGVYRGLALWRHAREKRGSAMVAARRKRRVAFMVTGKNPSARRKLRLSAPSAACAPRRPR